jgi:hypothetical protein
MKFLFLLGAVVVIYVVFVREPPVEPVKEVVPQTHAAQPAPVASAPRDPVAAAVTSGIRRPIDRTHAVMDQVRGRNGAGEF